MKWGVATVGKFCDSEIVAAQVLPIFSNHSLGMQVGESIDKQSRFCPRIPYRTQECRLITCQSDQIATSGVRSINQHYRFSISCEVSMDAVRPTSTGPS